MKKFFIIVGSVIVAVLLFFICANVTGMGTDNAARVADSDSQGEIVRRTSPTSKAAPKASPRPQTIREGTHEVGVDVKPGKYKMDGAMGGIFTYCSWTVRAKSETGDILDFGAVNGTEETGRVTLAKGQFFETSGCKEWYVVK